MATAAVIPPEVPPDYIVLELDVVSKNIRVDSEPLKKFMRKLMVYVRENAAKTFADMKYQSNKELMEARTAMRSLIEERSQEIEAKLMADPRIAELQADVATLKEHFGELDSKHSQISITLDRVEGEVIKTSATDINDLGDIRRVVRQFKDDNESSKRTIKDLARRVESDIEELSDRCGQNEEAIGSQVQRANEHGTRIEDAEEALSRLQEELGDAQQLLTQLGTTKAEKSDLKSLTTETRAIGQLAEKGAAAADLIPRVSSLELTRRNFDTLITKNKSSIQALEQGAEEATHRMDALMESINDAEQRQLAALDERTACLTGQQNFVAARMAEADSHLHEIIKKLKAWGSKADVSDVASLKATLASLTQSMKDKEEAVLFGARCLSCNRVFDDVQRDADVVDLTLERQKGQVFAEIQRALHSPRCDPKDLNLLTVKIGRPARVRAKDSVAMYAGRDALSTTRGLEDVHLTPLRHAGTATVPSTPQTTGRYAPATTPRPNTTQGTQHQQQRRQLRGTSANGPTSGLQHQDVPVGTRRLAELVRSTTDSISCPTSSQLS